jgi:hypothetical protein
VRPTTAEENSSLHPLSSADKEIQRVISIGRSLPRQNDLWCLPWNRKLLANCSNQVEHKESPPFCRRAPVSINQSFEDYFFPLPLPECDCCPPFDEDSRLGWFCVPDFELLLSLP